MKYFQHSQQVRREITVRPTLLETIKGAFDGKTESFSFGGTVELYRIGRLPSGLHLALRSFRTDMDEGKGSLDSQCCQMEMYCQNAEELSTAGEPVPDFCVGITYKDKAGILTEDLTSGGQYEFEHHPDNSYGFIIKGESKIKVFVDIDGLFKYRQNLQQKYFSNEGVISL